MGVPLNAFIQGQQAAQSLLAQLQQVLAARQSMGIQRAQEQRQAALFPQQQELLQAQAELARAKPELEQIKAASFELPTEVSDEELNLLSPPLRLAIRGAKARGEKSIRVPANIFGQLNTAASRSGDVLAQIQGRADVADAQIQGRASEGEKNRASREGIARERIRVADERTAVMERTMGAARGTLRPILDAEGVLTGDFINNRTGEIVSNPTAEGMRLSAETNPVRENRKKLTIVKNMVSNIRKAAEGLARGDDLVNNATLLQAQMATFGQIAKGLGGEAGVLTEQDISRVSASIPGIIESYGAGYNDMLRGRIATKIANIEDILKKVEEASLEGTVRGKKPVAPAKPTADSVINKFGLNP